MNIDTVFAIYINNYNKYILERIKKHSELFNKNNFYISFVDNHSFNVDDFSKNINFYPYDKKFSLSAQKNIAFKKCKSDYVLLSDPDFFPSKNFYEEMMDILSVIKNIDKTPFFIFPAYYANKAWSEKIFSSSNELYEEVIMSFLLSSTTESVFKNCNFISSYSNVILLSKEIMYYIGGYNENFDGFGSEDFEFMIRALIAFGMHPLPFALELDLYQPATKYFFMPNKSFVGFRRLLELYTFSIECTGKRFVHLFHDKTQNEWYLKKDKKRIRLHQETYKYLKNPCCILDYDWIEHKNKIICIISDKNKWRAFLTLRCKDFYTVRYESNKLTFNDCIELSDKYNTEYFAFYEDFYNCNIDLINKLIHNKFKIYKVNNDDLKKIGVHKINIDDMSYSVSRINTNINYKKNYFVNNIFYIIKRILHNKINIIKSNI